MPRALVLFWEAGHQEGGHAGITFQPQLDVCDWQLDWGLTRRVTSFGHQGLFHPHVSPELRHDNILEVEDPLHCFSEEAKLQGYKGLERMEMHSVVAMQSKVQSVGQAWVKGAAAARLSSPSCEASDPVA